MEYILKKKLKLSSRAVQHKKNTRSRSFDAVLLCLFKIAKLQINAPDGTALILDGISEH